MRLKPFQTVLLFILAVSALARMVLGQVPGVGNVGYDQTQFYAIPQHGIPSLFLGLTNGVNTTNNVMKDSPGSVALDIASRTLRDTSGNNSVLWNSHILVDDTGVQAMRWINLGRVLYDNFGNIAVDWGSRLLKDSSSNESMDWNSRFLDDSANVNSISWNSRLLQNSAGATTVDWQNLALTGNWSVTGNLSVSGVLTVNGSGVTNVGAAFGSWATVTANNNTTNFALDFGNTLLKRINASGDVCFQYLTNFGELTSYQIYSGGANRNILVPTNFAMISTSLGVIVGTNWSFTLTNDNRRRAWISFAYDGTVANGNVTNVTCAVNLCY